MKGLKKLVLATAVAAAPFAQADLTAMDDAFLDGMTGQAGLTIDMDLDLSIAEIRYADEDGYGEDILDGGYLTLSNLVVNGDQGNGTQAEIRGVTIDVDGTDGVVIGLGQIGGASTLAKLGDTAVDLSAYGLPAATPAVAGAVLSSNYWTGVNITGEFGINGAKAGDFAIKNFTNFVPNALAIEGVKKFGYDLTGATGPLIALTNDNATSDNLVAIDAGQTQIVTDAATAAGGLANVTEAGLTAATAAYILDTAGNDMADALTAGNYVAASIAIKAGGAVDSDGTGEQEGLTINAKVGFVIQEMSFTDDGNKMGVHNFTMYDTNEATGEIQAFSVTGLTIDVVDRVADANSSATAALQIAGLVTDGSIAMGDIFIGDHTNGSIGAVAIRDIDMSNTQIRIYGH